MAFQYNLPMIWVGNSNYKLAQLCVQMPVRKTTVRSAHLCVLYVVSNLFAAPCQVRVSSNVEMLGSPRYMPPSRLQFRLCSNVPSDDATSIIFKFDNLYLINHLQFDGLPEVKGESDFSKELRNPFLYVVDVSSDSVHWERVIDHSVCKCYHSQDLYFPCVAVR